MEKYLYFNPKQLMQTTTEALKALIKQSGLSQKQYAEKHKIEYKQFNRYATGRTVITMDKLQQLSFDDGKTIKISIV